jgi:hypothetical protein
MTQARTSQPTDASKTALTLARYSSWKTTLRRAPSPPELLYSLNGLLVVWMDRALPAFGDESLSY